MSIKQYLTISELISRNAASRGDRIAYRDSERAVTYADIERRTGRLAAKLREHLVSSGDRVAIYLENRVELLESHFSITRAGCVGVALNPLSSDDELSHFLDDAGCGLIITDLVHLDQVRRVTTPSRELGVVVVGELHSADLPAAVHSFEELIDSEPTALPPDDLSLDDVAWISYSSGSTGRPKGIVLTQRNILWAAHAFIDHYNYAESDELLAPIPLYHAFILIAAIFPSMVAGATVRITSGFDPDEVLSLFAEASYVFIPGVPAMFQRLLEYARERGIPVAVPRICMSGGAPMPAGLGAAWRDTFGIELLNGYGLTETQGIAFELPGAASEGASCGFPLKDVRLQLREPGTTEEVSPGGEGELWVSSPGVALGYHNQPELTASCFVDGWYCTGDLARLDESGRLFLTGRVKELIIRGGENIYPSEIEAVISRVDGVGAVAVAAQDDEKFGQVPVAYIVRHGDEPIDVAGLFRTCKHKLSPFKVPETVYEVDSIPQIGIGKVLRSKLVDHVVRQLGTLRQANTTPRSAGRSI